MATGYNHFKLYDPETKSIKSIAELVEQNIPFTNHSADTYYYLKDVDNNYSTKAYPVPVNGMGWERPVEITLYKEKVGNEYKPKTFIKKRKVLKIDWNSYYAYEFDDTYFGANIFIVYDFSRNCYCFLKKITTVTIATGEVGISWKDDDVYPNTYFNPENDIAIVALAGAGGGGSTNWSTCNGSGGGAGGTVWAVIDLGILKEAGYVTGTGGYYKYSCCCYLVHLANGGTGGSSGSDKNGRSGGYAYMCKLNATDFPTTTNILARNCIGLAEGGGGAFAKSGGGGLGGYGYISQGAIINHYAWRVPGIAYSDKSAVVNWDDSDYNDEQITGYSCGKGGNGGSGGGTGSKGSDATVTPAIGWDTSGNLVNTKTYTFSGGSSGANISGGGGASDIHAGAAGSGNGAGKAGTYGSGGSGGRWMMGYNKGGQGGDSYFRLYWK